MKNILTLYLVLGISLGAYAQQPYYNDVDLTKTGQDLYFELQAKIDMASATFNYDDIKDSLKITDEDPTNSSKVLLVYGYNDGDGNCTTDRSRLKIAFGGTSCEYNREHVFARSLANPSMGDVSATTTGIGADPHNLRPSDQQMNNDKGNKLFASGSGNAGNVSGGNFYPGDEWKGDVARMIMYMYTRYGDRCLPSLTAFGTNQGSTQMLQLLLQWNVDDPVNDFEDQRNPYLETVYGNRNPFIDNPYLATIIWGGPAAEDRWNILNLDEFSNNSVLAYPNPVSEILWIENSTTYPTQRYVIYDISGKKVFQNEIFNVENGINVSSLTPGMYILELHSANNKISKKIIVQ